MMKTCTKCNVGKPMTSEFFNKSSHAKCGFKPSCKECRKQEYQQNKEEIIKRRMNRYEANKQQELESFKRYREDNKEWLTEYHKEYYRENEETLKSKVLIRYHERKDIPEFKEKRKENYRKWISSDTGKEKSKISQKKRNELKKKLISNFTKKEWVEALEYFNNCCAYCGGQAKLQEDHVIPVTKGGHYTKQNIVPSCSPCNSSKWAHNLEYWYPKEPFFDNGRYDKIKEWILR